MARHGRSFAGDFTSIPETKVHHGRWLLQVAPHLRPPPVRSYFNPQDMVREELSPPGLRPVHPLPSTPSPTHIFPSIIPFPLLPFLHLSAVMEDLNPGPFKKAPGLRVRDNDAVARRMLAEYQRSQLGLGPSIARYKTDKDRIAGLKRGANTRSASPRTAMNSDVAQFAPMPENVLGGLGAEGFQFGTATSSFGGFGNKNNNAPASEQGQGGEMDRIELTSPGPSDGNTTNSFGGFGQQQQPTMASNNTGSNTGINNPFSGFSQQPNSNSFTSGSFGPQNGLAFGNNTNAPTNNNNSFSQPANNSFNQPQNTSFNQQASTSSFSQQANNTSGMDGWSAFKSGPPAAQTNGNQSFGASVFSNMTAANTSNMNFSQSFNVQQARKDDDEEMDMGGSPEKPTRAQQSTMFSNNNGASHPQQPNMPPRNSGSPFGGMTYPNGSSSQQQSNMPPRNSGTPFGGMTNPNGSSSQQQSNIPPRNSGTPFGGMTNPNGSSSQQSNIPPRNSGSPFGGMTNPNGSSSQQSNIPPRNSGSPFGGMTNPNGYSSQQTVTSASQPFGASNSQQSNMPPRNSGSPFGGMTNPNGYSSQQTVTSASQPFGASTPNKQQNNASTMFNQAPTQTPAPPGGDLFSRISYPNTSSNAQPFGSSTPNGQQNNASTMFNQPPTQTPAPPGGDLFSRISYPNTSSNAQPFGSSTPNGQQNNASTMFNQPPTQTPAPPGGDLFSRITYPNTSSNQQQTAAPAAQPLDASTNGQHKGTSTLFTQAPTQTPAPPDRNLFSRITKPDDSPSTPQQTTAPAARPFGSSTPAVQHMNTTTLFTQPKRQAQAPTGGDLFGRITHPTQSSTPQQVPQQAEQPSVPTAPTATAPVAPVPNAVTDTPSSIMSAGQLEKIRKLNEGLIKHLSKAAPHADFTKTLKYYKGQMKKITGVTGASETRKQLLQATSTSQPAVGTQSLFKPASVPQQTPQAAPAATNLFDFTPRVPATEPSKKRRAEDAATAVLKRRKSNGTDARSELDAGASDTSKLFEAALEQPAPSGGFTPSNVNNGQKNAPKPASPSKAGGFAPSASTTASSSMFAGFKPSTTAPAANGFKPIAGGTQQGSTASFLSSFGQNAKKQEDEARKKARDEDFDSEEDDPEEWEKKYEAEQARKKAEFSAVSAGGFKPNAPVSAPMFGGFKPSTSSTAPSGGFKPNAPAPAPTFGGFKPSTSSTASSGGFKPVVPGISSSGGETTQTTASASKKRRGPFEEEDDDDDEGQKWLDNKRRSDAVKARKDAAKALHADANDGDDESGSGSESEGEDGSQSCDDGSEQEELDPHGNDEFNVANNDEGNTSHEDTSAGNSKTDDDNAGAPRSSANMSGFAPPPSYDSPFAQGPFKPSTSFTPFTPFAASTPQSKDKPSNESATPYAKSVFGQSTNSTFLGGANFSPQEATPAKATPFGKGGFGQSALGQSMFGQSQQSTQATPFGSGGFGQSTFGQSQQSKPGQSLFGGSPVKFGGGNENTDMTPRRFGASTNPNFDDMPTPKNGPGEWPPRPGMAKPLDGTDDAPNPPQFSMPSMNQNTGAQPSQGENNNEENDEDATNDPQVENMTALLASELDESDVLYHVEKAKAFKFEIKGKMTTKTWNEKALGPVWLLKNKATGKTRVLLKVPPFGKPGVNFNLLTSADMYKSQGKRVMASFIDHIHEKEAKAPSQWYIQFGKEADAAEMGRLMKEQAGQQ